MFGCNFTFLKSYESLELLKLNKLQNVFSATFLVLVKYMNGDLARYGQTSALSTVLSLEHCKC